MFERCIPDLLQVTSCDFDDSISEFLSTSPCILRSSLKNEGNISFLGAGKSLSFKQIYDEESYKNAYMEISAQENLDEIILQKQIFYIDHLTVLQDEDFFYGNFISEGESGFFVLSPLTKMGRFPHEKLLIPFLELLKHRLEKGKWLFELGISQQGIFLFQAVLVPVNLLNSVFTDDLLCKILNTKSAIQTAPSFWQLLSREWQAFLFRRQDHSKSSVSAAFANWYFLFHYFYLYCKMNRRHGYDSDFVDFLKLSYGKQSNWQTEIIKKHLKLATEIRKNESEPFVPASFTAMSGGAYFLGKGLHEGIIGRDALLLKELIPDTIYRVPSSKIIITPSSQILGHGILAAVERNINILANVEEKLFASLTPSEHFCIDFEKGSFVIKS
ncbi:MAG: hypothetical protein HYV97_02630 [Bdellovibrio sp.]|nr:hypothetical protein [Bdellovibrio sp.]